MTAKASTRSACAARPSKGVLVKEEDSLQLSKEDILGFIFRPAFSTADVVTETSGRGVGMDVVRTSVMRLGGTIHLDSEVGRGTTFTMQMPLSAAVQEVLLGQHRQPDHGHSRPLRGRVGRGER
jgi:chemotaxis protein histidine kinase CheA